VSSTEVRPAPGARRKARPPGTTGLLRAAGDRLTGGEPVRFDSWAGAIWVVTIGLDFFWLANPAVLSPFDESLQRASIATTIAVLATLPRFRLPRPSWAVLAVLAFGFASALWSTAPGATVGFTATFLLIATLATVIASIADARTIVHGMMLGGLLFLGASWYALHEHLPRAEIPLYGSGYLAGASGNRNALSYTMALALAFAISFVPRQWWARVTWVLATGTIAAGVYLTQSGTGLGASLILLAVAVVLIVVDRRGRRRSRGARRLWSAAALGVLTLVGAAVGVELLGRLLERDMSTLTGRTPLWEAIWTATTGVDRWVGSGWGSVWPHTWNPAPPSAQYAEIIERTGYVLYHGHNSALDLLPEIGILGIAVYASTYVQAVVRALRLRDPRRGVDPARLAAGRATLLGVLGLLLFGVTEPMSTVPLGWFVVVVLATGIAPATATPAGRRADPGGRGARRAPAPGTPSPVPQPEGVGSPRNRIS
jgi:O-antigen ligase